jgi:hypothetical protein
MMRPLFIGDPSGYPPDLEIGDDGHVT